MFLEKLVECVMVSLDHNPVPSLAVPLQTLRTKVSSVHRSSSTVQTVVNSSLLTVSNGLQDALKENGSRENSEADTRSTA